MTASSSPSFLLAAGPLADPTCPAFADEMCHCRHGSDGHAVIQEADGTVVAACLAEVEGHWMEHILLRKPRCVEIRGKLCRVEQGVRQP
ncbi:MAG: hypothetical protein ACYDFT_00230 [Thermoplasmata archaeon]